MKILPQLYCAFQSLLQNLPGPEAPHFGDPGPQAALSWIATIIAGFLLFFLLALFLLFLCLVVACFFIYKPLGKVPPEYRRLSPPLVWLLLIPLFGLIWGFFVYPQVSQSLKQYATARGNQRLMHSDCGETLGWILAVLVVGVHVPNLGLLALIAALVVFVIYLAKINQIADELAKGYGAAPDYAGSYPPPQSGTDNFS